jgi:hypothetical protein
VKENLAEVRSILQDIETPMRSAGNLALALRMLASSDDIPKGAGAALDAVADLIFMKLVEIIEGRERVLELARSCS